MVTNSLRARFARYSLLQVASFLGLALLSAPLADADQQAAPPTSIPNNQWTDPATGELRPILEGESSTEREFTFAAGGRGLSENTLQTLAQIIDSAIRAAIPTTPWEAPKILGGTYLLELIQPAAFLDNYMDTPAGINYLFDASYRDRTRFGSRLAIDRWITGSPLPFGGTPSSMEFMSKVDRVALGGGFSEAVEGRCGAVPWDVDAHISKMKSGLATVNGILAILRPALNLVDFFGRRSPASLPLSYRSFVAFESVRTRQNLKLNNREIFVISVEEQHAYDGRLYENYMRNPATVSKPREVLQFIEVETDLSRSATTDPTVLAALRADQITLMRIIRNAFAAVNQQHSDPAYLVLQPQTRGKYPQGFDALYFIRGDVNRDGQVNISDPIALLYSMLLGQGTVDMRASDANSDGKVDISDPIYILNYLFLRGPAIAGPYPLWGTGS